MDWGTGTEDWGTGKQVRSLLAVPGVRTLRDGGRVIVVLP